MSQSSKKSLPFFADLVQQLSENKEERKKRLDLLENWKKSISSSSLTEQVDALQEAICLAIKMLQGEGSASSKSGSQTPSAPVS